MEQVEAAHEEAQKKFSEALRRLETVIQGGRFDSGDARWSPSRIAMLRALLAGTQRLATPSRELWPKRIQWTAKRDGPCEATGGAHVDAAALAPNRVCLSLKALSRFSWAELERKLVPLYAHELGHLYLDRGQPEEDERRAVDLAAFFEELPDLAFPDSARALHFSEKLNLEYYPSQARVCSGLTLGMARAIAREALQDFKAPDRGIFFPPALNALLAPGLAFLASFVAKNADIASCEANPREFFLVDRAEEASRSFRDARAYWLGFYADVLPPP